MDYHKYKMTSIIGGTNFSKQSKELLDKILLIDSLLDTSKELTYVVK